MDGWTLRLTAAALLTLCGAWGGHSLAASRRLRATQLQAVIAAVERLEINMLERMLPLKEALEAAGHEAFGAVGAGMTGARSALVAWLNGVDGLRGRGGALSALTDGDVEALMRLFEGLGVSGASEQRLLLVGVREELTRLHLDARKKADEQAKLYTSLGLITGLALAICLI